MTHIEASERIDGTQGSGTATNQYESPRIYELGSVADLTGGTFGPQPDMAGQTSP